MRQSAPTFTAPNQLLNLPPPPSRNQPFRVGGVRAAEGRIVGWNGRAMLSSSSTGLIRPGFDAMSVSKSTKQPAESTTSSGMRLSTRTDLLTSRRRPSGA
uniref:Uncharacterized protein n=1 Tax=Plectus sambesii TaxID=2011161 RepID=A0A914V4K8_9BILA